MKFLVALLFAALNLPFVFAAWGFTDSGSAYVVDTGASLVFSIDKTNGDLSSIKYKGKEYNGYNRKNSHIQSGFGKSDVKIQQFTTPANIIKVTVTYGTIIQTYIARYGNNNIYMLTRKGDNTVPALRYIVRMIANQFDKSTNDADYQDKPETTIEASDVTRNSATTFTKSKHYSGAAYGRTIDYDYIGKTSSSVGMFLIRSNHEKASGGPFFRSLLRRATTAEEDLYEILYYNMGTTDPERFGLQGPYLLSFTDGGAPSSNLFARRADYSWMDKLGITDWVPASGRGYVSGVGISNMKSRHTYVAGLSNAKAQYWDTAASSGGAYKMTGVLPGTYTLTIYKDEIAVSTRSVEVKAGAGTAVNTITPSDPSDTTAIWRIGEWDGSPAGFTNFDTTPMKPTYMHPSDGRLASWNTPNYIVGTSNAASAMPGYMWMDVNNDHLIYFKLSAAQTATSHKVRIGITEAFAGGRPKISINGWTSPNPAASSQASTRSLTVGTYRGTNHMFTYDVPASAFLAAGENNIMKITIISGSSGVTYLSPGVSLDAIDFL